MGASLLAAALLVAAEPPKSVEISVADAETGKPINGAVIRLFNGVRPTPYAFTDAAGKATAEYPAQGHFTFDVHSPDHIQQRFDFDEGKGRPAKVSVKLRRGERTVGGVVVDEAGKPVAGAAVRFSAYLGKPRRISPGARELVCDIDAVTDAQGHWTLRCVDASPNSLHFDVKHPEFVYIWYHKPVAAELLDGKAKVVLKRGVEVRGKVVDERGKPVEGAALVAVSGRNPALDFAPRVRTGADGAFRFGGLDRGRNVLTVQAPGRSPAFKVFERLERPTEFTFTLPPGRVVKGRVKDPAGKPVGGAYVSVAFAGDSYTGGPSLQLWTTAKGDGSFELADAPADAFILRASKTGYLFSEGVSLPLGNTETTLVLKPGPKLRGTVVDAQTGKPISAFTVGFNFCGLDGSTGNPLPAPFGFNRHFEETKGKDGRFELTHRQTLDRPAQVAAWATGYKLTRSEPFPNDGKDRDFTLKLEKETRTPLAGVVKLPDGRPAAGAVVVKTTRVDRVSGFSNGALIDESRTGSWRRCDEQGRFSFPPQDEEPFALGASHDGGWAAWEPKPGAKPGESMTLTLAAWATIKGRLLVDGKPAAGANITYYADRPIYVDEQRLEVQFRAEAKTDAAGAFVLRRVPTQPGKVFRFIDFGRGGGPNILLAAVDPKPGETVDLCDARQQGRAVVGRLKLPPKLQGDLADPNAPSYVCTGTDCRAITDRPWVPYPEEIKRQGREAQDEWYRRWRRSPEGRSYYQDFQHLSIWLEPDGRFRIDGARPGPFVLRMPLRSASGDEREPGDLLATVTKHFVVPPMPNGYDDTPLDLGEIDVVESKIVRRGQKMPAFAAGGLDGKEWRLSADTGNVRVLDFWATWCGPCVKALPTLAALHEEHGGKGLEVVSLSVDEEAKTAAALVAKEKCRWRQAHVGPRSPLLQTLGVTAYPTFFVLDKAGTVLYRGHSVEAAAKAARSALGQ